MVLALLARGFRYDEILAMPEEEAHQYLDDWQAMNNPQGTVKKYRVKRK
jgi:hypothetical protein